MLTPFFYYHFMSYETLDIIDDAYIPLLFFLYVVYSLIYWRHGDKRAGLRGLVGVLLCYLLMFIDNTYHLWPKLGLDYSTHTAVSFALVYFLIHKHAKHQRSTQLTVLSLMVYFILMVYQRYHTVTDIVSTVIVVGALQALLYHRLLQTKK